MFEAELVAPFALGGEGLAAFESAERRAVGSKVLSFGEFGFEVVE